MLRTTGILTGPYQYVQPVSRFLAFINGVSPLLNFQIIISLFSLYYYCFHYCNLKIPLLFISWSFYFVQYVHMSHLNLTFIFNLPPWFQDKGKVKITKICWYIRTRHPLSVGPRIWIGTEYSEPRTMTQRCQNTTNAYTANERETPLHNVTVNAKNDGKHKGCERTQRETSHATSSNIKKSPHTNFSWFVN